MASSSRHPGRRRRYLETIDFVTRGMDFLCGSTTELNLTPVSQSAPVLPGNLGLVRCRTRVLGGDNVPTPRPAPVRSTKDIIRSALTDFWFSFNPDEPDPEEVPDVPLDDLWDAIRLRTAPWGADDWELPTPPDSLVDDEGSGFSQTSDISTPDDDVDFSDPSPGRDSPVGAAAPQDHGRRRHQRLLRPHPSKCLVLFYKRTQFHAF